MNPKIEKLKAEREKNVNKINTLQTRNKEIDGQIIELENTDIIGLTRDSGITPDMLAKLIQSMKQNPNPRGFAEVDEMEGTHEED